MKQLLQLVRSFSIATTLLLAPVSAFGQTLPKLKLTANRRYLQYENGKPFFYLGDTAWELFHRRNREEVAQYLTNRAQKGFTVIQAVVLAQLGGLTVPNPYGDLPLIEGPTRPTSATWISSSTKPKRWACTLGCCRLGAAIGPWARQRSIRRMPASTGAFSARVTKTNRSSGCWAATVRSPTTPNVPSLMRWRRAWAKAMVVHI